MGVNEQKLGLWLTDPTVPDARPCWMRQRTRLRPHDGKRRKGWVPQHWAAWADLRDWYILYREGGKPTDFSSTINGHKGALRGPGYIHDGEGELTTVMEGRSGAWEKLLGHLADHPANSAHPYVSLGQVRSFGFYPTVKRIDIPDAADDFFGLAVTAGISPMRARIQRRGLKAVQWVYRWWNLGEPTFDGWRDET